MSAEELIRALRSIRLAEAASPETDIHDAVAAAMTAAGVPYQREVTIGPRSRIDFMSGRTGIEVKKGRPNQPLLEKQLKRYAETGAVDHLVVLLEKRVPGLFTEVSGVPVTQISLLNLWGISI